MQAFREAVVKSVALSCLLARDYVPQGAPPPTAEMVAHELPRVLHTLSAIQSTVGMGLEALVATDPPALLEATAARVVDVRRATALIIERGHQDMVYSAMTYMHKPPLATARRIQKVTMEVARCLGVDVSDDFDDGVGDMYDNAHGMLMRV